MLLQAEQIARVCHEANRAYCLAIGDGTQTSWETAPDWQRTSAINGVHLALRSPMVDARALHDSWLAEKREQGWKFGHVKDATKKEHPCFLPYDQLPPEQRTKDEIFRAIVNACRGTA